MRLNSSIRSAFVRAATPAALADQPLTTTALADHDTQGMSHNTELPGDAELLEKIRDAITGYHLALDGRKHGGIAASNALDAIREAMSMPWVPGAAAQAQAQAQAQAKGGAA